MPKVRYGVPHWLGAASRAPRAPSPRLRRHRDTGVAIVGGGMVGCATAYLFAASGVEVTLVESAGVGEAGAATRAGLVMQEPEADFRALAERYGKAAARRLWRMWRRAMLDGAATLRRLRIRCQLEPQDAIYFTRSPDRLDDLRREYRDRRSAGLDAVWLGAERLRAATRIDALGGIRTRGNQQLDPYRATVGLATAAARRGAAIFERSPVRRIAGDRTGVDLATAHGTLRADRVIVATGDAGPLFPALARHLRTSETYTVATPPIPARTRAALGRRAAMLWDTDDPYHYLRWTRDHRLVFGGADQAPVAPRRRPAVLVQRAGQLMYELSTLYPAVSGIQAERAWHGQVATAVDQLPVVGAHRGYPRHLFALGTGGHGLAAAFLAARILLRAHRDTPEKDDGLVAFGRLPR